MKNRTATYLSENWTEYELTHLKGTRPMVAGGRALAIKTRKGVVLNVRPKVRGGAISAIKAQRSQNKARGAGLAKKSS